MIFRRAGITSFIEGREAPHFLGGLSRVKIKKGGGNGGHNGLKNIDNLAGNNYWRVRIGVGRPAEKSMVVSYVLGNFTKEEFEKLKRIKKIISENLSILISNDPKKLESLINS